MIVPKPPNALLLHGLTGMPSEMRPLERHLKTLGCEIAVPLLPGHGATHRELLATTWNDWMAGARDALEDLAARPEPVVIAGLSMGALLAVLLAAEDPRVAGIVLLSPTLRYDGSSIPWTRHLLPLAHVLPFVGRLTYWTETPPYGLKDERLQRRITRSVEAAKRGESTRFGLFRTYTGAIRELNRMVREVRVKARYARCPALVLHSVEDTVTSIRNAEEIHALLGATDKAIGWLSGCDHVITLDLQKREVARQVGEFVSRIGSGLGQKEATRQLELADRVPLVEAGEANVRARIGGEAVHDERLRGEVRGVARRVDDAAPEKLLLGIADEDVAGDTRALEIETDGPARAIDVLVDQDGGPIRRHSHR
jgi:carboxylesterase